MVTKGRTVTILGRPEESGFYFCSVNMNGTVHNSQVATVNISGNHHIHFSFCHYLDYVIGSLEREVMYISSSKVYMILPFY